MPRRLLLLACVLALATAASDVFIATEENFDDLISKNENVLVEFFAPWCGHCKNFAPEYEKAATLLKKQGSSVIVATVDGDSQKGLTQRYDVHGFPNIKLFRRDKHPLAYEGSRTAEEVIRFVDARTSKPAQFNSMNELSDFRAKYPSTLVLFYRNAADSTAVMKQFLSECEAVTEPKCGHTTLAEAVQTYVAEGQSHAIVSFKNDDPIVDRFNGTTSSELRTFIKAYGPRLVTLADEGNLKEILLPDPGVLMVAAGDTPVDAAGKAAALEFAKAWRGKLRVYLAERSHETVAESLQKFMGIGATFNPGATLLIILERIPGGDASKKYVITSHGSLESELNRMASMWEAKTLPRHVKSEPEFPADGKKLVTLVGSSFERTINNTHAFVEFYAPWCGHCKNLAPIWERFATRAAGVFPNVVVAKMDETANEAPGVVVSGYPSLLFFPKDGEPYVTFNGKRDLDSFEEFVEDQLEEYGERQRQKQRKADKSAKGAAKGAAKGKTKTKKTASRDDL